MCKRGSFHTIEMLGFAPVSYSIMVLADFLLSSSLFWWVISDRAVASLSLITAALRPVITRNHKQKTICGKFSNWKSS